MNEAARLKLERGIYLMPVVNCVSVAAAWLGQDRVAARPSRSVLQAQKLFLDAFVQIWSSI
jgi:hypothetical protein